MAKPRDKAKQEQAASARAEFQRRKRRRAWITRGIGVLVVGAIAASIGFCELRHRNLVSAVTTTTYAGGQHLAGPITYRESPPMGGTHNVVWQNCGIYDGPIHNEHAVHSMEHGAVWITYRPGLADADIARLKSLAGDDYMLLSPYPFLKAPVVASSWNHQILLESATDPRLTAFISEYKNNPASTPELGAPCTGGTSALVAGNTLGTAGEPGAPPAPMRR